MVLQKNKLSPNIIKRTFSRFVFNEFESSILAFFIPDYEKFYKDGRFKYYDSYVDFHNKKETNERIKLYREFSMFLIECVNISSELISNTKRERRFIYLDKFITDDTNPSECIQNWLDLKLTILSEQIYSEKDLKLYINTCFAAEVIELPDNIKFSYLYMSTPKGTRAVNLEKCIVTFKRDSLSYEDFAHIITQSRSSIIAQVSRDDTNNTCIHIFGIDNRNKILRDTNKQAYIKFIYNE